MPIRFYLMPAVTEMIDDRLTKHPKYDTLYAGSDWQVMDYGIEGSFLVAVNVTTGVHNAIAANADVASFPANLNTQIGAALGTVTTQAESRHIPMAGITATSTYRQLLRRVVLCCQLAQRIDGVQERLWQKALRSSLFGNGIALDSTFNSLPVRIQTTLVATFDSFSFDRSVLTGAFTLRQILAAFNTQWPSGEIDMLGVKL